MANNNFNSSQTGLMATYNAAESTLVINGNLMYGFMSGDNMFQITWDNDNMTVSTDSMGTSVASINNKDSATMTINLNQMSPCNAILLDLANRHVEFPVDARTSSEHWSTAYAYISKIPDLANGDNAQVRAWTIHMLNAKCESTLQNA